MKICGTNPPQPFSSTGNVMTVVFHTDVSAVGRGFLFNWTAVDQVVTTPGTTLEPGTTPGKYFLLSLLLIFMWIDINKCSRCKSVSTGIEARFDDWSVYLNG
jgi:hypothetical protein